MAENIASLDVLPFANIADRTQTVRQAREKLKATLTVLVSIFNYPA